MLTPIILLEELLRFREAPIPETAGFTWKHDQLCDRCSSQLNKLGDSFLKYHHVTYVVQGPRDNGVDVLLKASRAEDEPDALVGIQVKSYNELDDKNNDLSKQLKAGYHDARNHYGSSLARYYIALCGDADKHSKRISAITAEFSKEQAVRVIGPRHLLTFMTLPDATLSAIVDRFLKEDDYVRSRARNEVHGYTDSEIYFLLKCLAHAFESGSDQLPYNYFEQDFDLQSFDDLFGNGEFLKVHWKFEDSVLETYAEPSSTRVRTEEFAAIRALYYDIQIRYGEDAHDLFNHLYEFLKI